MHRHPKYPLTMRLVIQDPGSTNPEVLAEGEFLPVRSASAENGLSVRFEDENGVEYGIEMNWRALMMVAENLVADGLERGLLHPTNIAFRVVESGKWRDVVLKSEGSFGSGMFAWILSCYKSPEVHLDWIEQQLNVARAELKRRREEDAERKKRNREIRERRKLEAARAEASA